jgi:hypothetical protein
VHAVFLTDITTTQLDRFYGKYTQNTKDNFERGTAL